jgi:mRNA-degrading endonuclease RelE of RelBE toxin-antitoxin system
MFQINTISHFDRELKNLIKKYPSAISDFQTLIQSLSKNPYQGSPLGKDCYKVRMAISSKSKGKSGGARVIICVKVVAEKITLISIYDKSVQSDIDSKFLVKLLRENGLL